MPRSSRGSTSHRGHRTRGRHNVTAQSTTPITTLEETSAGGDVEKASTYDQTAPPRTVISSPQPSTAPVSGTTMGGDLLLTKELIRITVLAVVVVALLVTFTTLIR